ncbi:MAG: PIN domain-containing protein [Bacillota bacterium]
MQKKRKLIDTNLVIRFLSNDPPVQAEKVERFINDACSNGEQLFLHDVCIAETVWVLEKVYKTTRPNIVALLRDFFALPCITCVEPKLIDAALNAYANNNVDWIDAWLAAYSELHDNGEIFSFDRDFDKLTGIKRYEP